MASVAARRRREQQAVLAYRLRHIQGKQTGQIAAELGVSATYVKKLIQEGARTCVSDEMRDEAKASALAELDALRAEAYEWLHKTYVTVDRGEVVIDPRSGEPVRDYAPNMAALDRILKLEKRRSEIYGYDAPKRSTVSVVTEDAIMAEINRLEAEMAAAEAEAEQRQRS